MSEPSFLPESIIHSYTRANIELPQMLLAQVIRVGEASTHGIVNGEMPWQVLARPLSNNQIVEGIAPSIKKAHAAYGIECKLDPDPSAAYGYDQSTRQFTLSHIRGQVYRATSGVREVAVRYFDQTVPPSDSDGPGSSQQQKPFPGMSGSKKAELLFTSDDLHAHRIALLGLWRQAGASLTARASLAKEWREALRRHDSSKDRKSFRESTMRMHDMLLQAVQDEVQDALPAISSETGVDLSRVTFLRGQNRQR